MNLHDLFDARTIAAYWTEYASNQIPYLGRGLFTLRKKMGLDLKWIKGHKGLPVTLMPSTFDAKARFRERIGVSQIVTEMPFFREGYLIKEIDRQEILRVQESNDPYAQSVLANIFNDVASLIEGAAVVRERMRMQLLAPLDGSPGISIRANNVDYTYNYDIDGEFRANNFLELQGNDMWSDPASNPIEDIRAAQEEIEDRTGTRPTLLIMSRKTFNYLLKNEVVRSAILAQNLTANIFMTEEIVKNVFSTLLGVTIVVYNKKYVNDDKQTAQFYPDDMVTLIPTGALGSTWFGTPPEEADRQFNSPDVITNIVDIGVAITTIKIPHPVNIQTLASEIVLPSFERMDEVYVIKVA